LQWGAFVLSNRVVDVINRLSSRQFYLFLCAIALVVYGVRGFGFPESVQGDDLDLYFHAVNRVAATTGFGQFDTFGFFDPYNGYLIVLLRVFTKLAMLGNDTNFTTHAFLLMTPLFAVTMAGIGAIVARVTSRFIALLALTFLVFLPFSNLVILAQINTVAWPLALAMIVIAATRTYPQTWFGKVGLAIVFSLTTLSSGTMLIAIALLGLGIIEGLKRINRYEIALFLIGGISFFVQWMSYTPRTNPKLPIAGELYKAMFHFSPQFLRTKVNQPLFAEDHIILWIIPVMLFIIWVVFAIETAKVDRHLLVSAIKLLGAGFMLLALLIRGNGWFNTHYLFIPVSMFWISLALVYYGSRHHVSSRFALAIASVLFAVSYSGTYYLL
jgi:hypothetical protein